MALNVQYNEKTPSSFMVMIFCYRCLCKMELSSYPMDTQRCLFIMMSYTYSHKDIRLLWHKNPFLHSKHQLPISNYKLLPIIFQKARKRYLISNDKEHVFEHLILKFVVRRAILYFVYKTYIPMILLVVFNIGSYWIPDTALPARMSLIVTTFLSSVFMLQSVSDDNVRTTTTTSLQVFITFSIGMCFF